MTVRHNIDTCSMLVEFNASVWTARKLDRSTSEEVVNSKNAAAKDAARVNKHLLAGRNELEEINSFVSTIRRFVEDNTLPWSDSGIRLLPTKKFLDFNDHMGALEEKFTTMVAEFVSIYPSLITAQAMALGDMFKRDEYPSANEIEHKFGFRLHYMPVPTAGDFRIDVGNEAQDELRAQLEKIAQERIDNAMSHARGKLKGHLDRLMKQLRTEGGGKTKDGKAKMPSIYDSLIDGGIELCDALESLNLVNDPTIEGARMELKALLNQFDIKDLRKLPEARTEMRTQVAEIMDKFAF